MDSGGQDSGWGFILVYLWGWGEGGVNASRLFGRETRGRFEVVSQRSAEVRRGDEGTQGLKESELAL